MAKPLLKVYTVEEDYCEYPVAVKLAMDDGTVQTYALENKTEYMFRQVMDSLDKMTVGYQYKPNKPRRCKNRPHRW